jgi:hypothetical protein
MADWVCPSCGNRKKVICPVCGIDKEAGQTCRDCGSEFSHTGCPNCDYSERHQPQMNFGDYKVKIKKVIKLRKEKYLTYYELMRLGAILEPTALNKLCVNDPIFIKNISKAAFNLKKEEGILELCKLKGVDRKFASGVYTILEAGLD